MKEFQYYFGYKDGRATIFAKEMRNPDAKLQSVEVEGLTQEEMKLARIRFMHEIGDIDEE